ncbi:peptidoglycan-binding protein [Brevundimonas sp.]|uniref:peptidoglycan-binding protein n=1 Tax=Brevundimonas sp. TaxID=1871086 RepID=UPI0026059611|nr:peptidoglycan-binding protein [Brevundimonas sp.]
MRDTQVQIDAARVALAEPVARNGVSGTLAAACLAACAAVLLAGVMILGPGVAIEDPAPAQDQTF